MEKITFEFDMDSQVVNNDAPSTIDGGVGTPMRNSVLRKTAEKRQKSTIETENKTSSAGKRDWTFN